MARPFSSAIPGMKEFESVGYASSAEYPDLMKSLRRRHNKYFKVFRSGMSFGYRYSDKTKNSSEDIFGKIMTYCYDIRYIDKFVEFLVQEFLKKNPSPDQELRKAFTRLLHSNRLHWSGCYHAGKKVDIDFNQSE